MKPGALRGEKGDRVGDVVRRAPMAERHFGAPFRSPAARGCGRNRPRCRASPAASVSGLLMRLGQTAFTRMPSRREIVGQRFDEGMLRGVDDGRGDAIGLRHLAGLADDDDEAAAAAPCAYAAPRGAPVPRRRAPWSGSDAASASPATSSRRPGRCVPALLTTISMPPKALIDIVDKRGDISRACRHRRQSPLRR